MVSNYSYQITTFCTQIHAIGHVHHDHMQVGFPLSFRVLFIARMENGKLITFSFERNSLDKFVTDMIN